MWIRWTRYTRVIVVLICLISFLLIVLLDKHSDFLYIDHAKLRKICGPACDLGPKCQPIRNVVAINIHKYPSATLQSILFRFADSRNLTVVLPRRNNDLGYPDRFKPEYTFPLPSAVGKEYNILCHHARWHEKNIPKLMPKGTVYLAVIQDPLITFEAQYHLYEMDARFNTTFELFIRNPSLHLRDQPDQSLILRNPISTEFGLALKDFDDPAKINEKILQIRSTFSMIILAEYMDESLVLLKELLCWEWTDVVAFQFDVEGILSSDEDVKKHVKAHVSSWNSADSQFYQFFLEEFQRRKVRYGLKRFDSDLRYLRLMRTRWVESCQEAGDPNSQFDVTRGGTSDPTLATCQLLQLNMTDYTKVLRKKLWPTLVRSKKLL